VELYTAGLLRFEKWGHIDAISNYSVRRTLFVDIDTKQRTPRLLPNFNSAFREMGISYTALRISRSKRGWHYAFVLAESLTSTERVAAESILGDDKHRSAMNFARARNEKFMPKFWKQRWNIFYDYKLENK
jgi:hypothetical protein